MAGTNFMRTNFIATESRVLQAILIDHFHLVADYNKLVAFYFRFGMTVYSMFVLVFSHWAMAVKSRTVRQEFIIAQPTGIFFVIVFFSSAAVARSCNLNLYKQICQTMALETNSNAKLRWATVLDYYKPKPLYCFRVIDSTEISWLFCLKVSCFMLYIILIIDYTLNTIASSS